MIEVSLRPEVVAVEVEKLAPEGPLQGLVHRISSRRVGDSTWVLEVCGEDGENCDLRAKFTVKEVLGGQGSVIRAEPSSGKEDGAGWHAEVELAIYRALAAL